MEVRHRLILQWVAQKSCVRPTDWKLDAPSAELAIKKRRQGFNQPRGKSCAVVLEVRPQSESLGVSMIPGEVQILVIWSATIKTFGNDK